MSSEPWKEPVFGSGYEKAVQMWRDKGLNTGSSVHGFTVGQSQPSWNFIFLLYNADKATLTPGSLSIH